MLHPKIVPEVTSNRLRRLRCFRNELVAGSDNLQSLRQKRPSGSGRLSWRLAWPLRSLPMGLESASYTRRVAGCESFIPIPCGGSRRHRQDQVARGAPRVHWLCPGISRRSESPRCGGLVRWRCRCSCELLEQNSRSPSLGNGIGH